MAGTSNLPPAGVEAIVEGLSSFQGDVRSMNSALDSIRPRSTMLMDAFSGAWEMVKNFGREVLNVAEYALGKILADSIEFVVQKIGELVSVTIDAGSEFQTLELRLQGINLDTAIKSGMEYNQATEESIKKTKEQLEWLQKIAALTPYDNTDISNVYTLARSYGFSDDEAKKLTENTTNFASAMGLSGEVLERVIMNMGQMVQRGKITSTEMRDLARGSFMPLNDILQRIADNLNETGQTIVDNSGAISKSSGKLDEYQDKLSILQQRQKEWTDKTKESTKMTLRNQLENLQEKIDSEKAVMSSLATATPAKETVASVMKAISKPGGGLPAQLFIDAFNEMVQEEPRFVGAAERMAKTFKAASDNAMDIVKSIGGLNVVKPILDVIGARIAAFVSSFTDNPERWDRMVGAAKRVGDELSKIVGGLFDLLPTSESLADSAVKAIEGIATWLEKNGPGITAFFRELGTIVGGVATKIGRVFSIGGAPKPEQKGGAPVVPAFDRQMMAEVPRPEAEPIWQGFLDIIQKIADFIDNTLIPAFVKVQVWFEINKPLIDKFWATLGEIMGEVISDIFSQPEKKGGGKDVLSLITDFMQFVIDNKDEIAKWVEILWSLFVVWQVISTIWVVVVGLVISLGGFIIGLIAIVSGLVAILSFPVVGAIALVIAILGGLYLAFQANLLGIRDWVTKAVAWIEQLGRDVSVGIQRIILAIKDVGWWELGNFIMQGIARGIALGVSYLASAARSAALSAYEAAKKALGIKSPSTLFMEIGEFTMEGFAQGIERAAGLAVGAMQNAVGQVAMPAMASMAAAQAGGNTVTNNRTASLTVNTSAPLEPILQDFNMLESLMGA